MFKTSVALIAVALLVACETRPARVVGPANSSSDVPSVAGSTTSTLAVSIHALYSPQDTTVRPNQQCEYRADATGGSGPITYYWTWSGLDSATNSPPRFLQAFVGAIPFNLAVTVRDSLGDSASTAKSVGVASRGIVCP